MGRYLFNKGQIWVTLIVLVLSAIFIRLGFWQLDRLNSRKAKVDATLFQMNAPVMDLNAESLEQDWFAMEYRRVVVTGEFDFSEEVLLRNQIWVDENNVHHPGIHLLTPFLIDGSDWAILVDRGWIPLEDADIQIRSGYQQTGIVRLSGIFRLPQSKSQMGLVREATLTTTETKRIVWSFVNTEAIAELLPYRLLPVYMQEEPQEVDTVLPYAKKEYPDLSEGAHLGFAFQWFALAGILWIGYPIMVQKQAQGEKDTG